MANPDAPFGFRVANHRAGGLVRQSEYQIAGGYNTSIFTGDLVTTAPGTNKRIAKAAAGDRVVGVFQGCYYVEPDGSPKFSKHWPANQAIAAGTVARAIVMDDPLVYLRVRANGPIAAADIGQLIDFIPGTGNVATGQATGAVDTSSIAATGEPLKLIELLNVVKNQYGDFAEVLVAISTHENIGGVLTGT